MNSYNDWFVATVALIGSAAALAAGLGPWENPYRLRTIAGVVDRYGMVVARAVWIVVAIISLIAGIAIASGVRPSYAKPDRGLIDNAK
ncbi:MAG: hypothetical protein KDB00_09515 [Planctomycetales bacterium]|nr:hypothetical protein [Planctomycetales bacterium]MCA9220916.1 hypothetical protein [Planctomycetales bacterium]